jgi:hypothetical protein
VLKAKALMPVNTESVWKSLHLSKTAYEGAPVLRKSVAKRAKSNAWFSFLGSFTSVILEKY